jgi:hypothetical protein
MAPREFVQHQFLGRLPFTEFADELSAPPQLLTVPCRRANLSPFGGRGGLPVTTPGFSEPGSAANGLVRAVRHLL